MDAYRCWCNPETPIGEHETAGDLLTRLGESGALVLRDALRTVEDGTADPVEQAEGDYPVAEKIRVNDAHIDFSAPVEAVDRQIRACTPNPGHDRTGCRRARARRRLSTLHVLRAHPTDMTNPERTRVVGVWGARSWKEECLDRHRLHTSGIAGGQGAGQEGDARRRLGARSPTLRKPRAAGNEVRVADWR